MVPTLPSLSLALLVSFLATIGTAEAGYGFLARMNRDAVAQELLTELTALLGHGRSHERLAYLTDALRPMYMALPKKEGGGVDESVARYALNRYFLTHRGWHITGIASDGERWNASSSTAMLNSKMPSFIIDLVEQHVVRKRLGLEELAVLAATVEDLIHSDALELLTMAYEVHNFSMQEALGNEEEEDLVIRTFVLFFTMPWTQGPHNDTSKVHKLLRAAYKNNPGWNDSMMWVEDLKGAIKYQDRGEHNPFSKRQGYFADYPSMVHFVEQIIDGFGVFQDIQCKGLKNTLVDLEMQERSDGRVLLANFYAPTLKGVHQFFNESPEYLKSLGALDERDPKQPSVIVPNYMYGPNFCLATENSPFRSFCCIDQCNVLMESLEQSIAHPVASPGFIAELVAALPSDSVAAPRNLSGSLRHKLDTIAEQHSGYVPLHGRLFAQWMSHAFPNECPQPRAAGVTDPLLTWDQWRQDRNTSAGAPKEVMQQFVDSAAETERAEDQGEASMLWTDEEELITSIDLQRLGGARAEQRRGQGSWMHVVLPCLAMCGAAGSLTAILLESVRTSISLLRPQVCKGTEARDGRLPRSVHTI
mmetsp:Transcript_72584/g.183527  ORF Transcript_72584/g.183527 Transcript_72584/m.183527 type:complete len:590 (-) Transcript_72584:68-1837(-)